MSITSLGVTPPTRVTGATPAPIPPVQPVQAPAPLAPAVRVDIRGRDQGSDPRSGIARAPAPEENAKAAQATMEPRIRIDQDTKAVVYQEVDPNSGDVVVQLPDPVVLKARAYAEAAEARAKPATRPLDRTA
ncbi:hypothetical protein ASF49_00225 [Methylobacterium sp. Leaf104]|uniref:hypothetical protein n=1 Tax=Methylobacterium TaxID=407 RepID=UPI0006FFCC4E|nr:MULTISPECIES: hypothetical protein [Methylobacterium]KQP42326.1 hypothetical protein ASF49_00225 [Methylobacterium sp. Leaf104]MCI9879158.1 hypothetical protein [Methylobacterium goesingense]